MTTEEVNAFNTAHEGIAWLDPWCDEDGWELYRLGPKRFIATVRSIECAEDVLEEGE